ncbi:MAG: DUF3810 domain-containing protein [Niastella sp.]|nr:DUF3810 domain-containing protein [Niastella sp.]
MKPIRKKRIILWLLGIVCLSIHILGYFPLVVEKGYSTGFYPVFSKQLRFLTGWLPWSLGDLLYGLLVIWLVWKILQFIKWVYKVKFKELSISFYKEKAGKGLMYLACIYIVFNVFWGINYDRKGIRWQLGLPSQKYTEAELIEMNGLLLNKLNEGKAYLLRQQLKLPDVKGLVPDVKKAYRQASFKYSFLKYENESLKPGLWSAWQSYTGITGYYNPFTGEAQVNKNIPAFLLPYTSCHEVAHQLGYAKEDEANFVGYLAAMSSTDTLFHYSVYFDLFLYANRNLYMLDSIAAKTFSEKLSNEVRADIMAMRKYQRQHRSFLQPVIIWIYTQFLLGNRQPQGILSYDEVVGFIIAYHKKFKVI